MLKAYLEENGWNTRQMGSNEYRVEGSDTVNDTTRKFWRASRVHNGPNDTHVERYLRLRFSQTLVPVGAFSICNLYMHPFLVILLGSKWSEQGDMAIPLERLQSIRSAGAKWCTRSLAIINRHNNEISTTE